MKKIHFIAVFLIILIVISASLIYYFFNKPETETQDLIGEPEIWNDKVIWHDKHNIWMYNTTTGEKEKVVTNGEFIFHTKIYNNKLFWIDDSSTVHKYKEETTIKIKDLKDHTESEFISVNHVTEFDVYEDIVVTWEGDNILIYDIDKGLLHNFSLDDRFTPQTIELNDKHVVWYDNNGFRIKVFDLRTQNLTEYKKNNFDIIGENIVEYEYIYPDNPDLHNNNILFLAQTKKPFQPDNQSYRIENNLYLLNLTTGNVSQISDDIWNEHSLGIYESNIVYNSRYKGQPDRIYVTSLQDPENRTVFNRSSGWIRGLKIYGEHIVWREDNDIMLGNIDTGEIKKIS